jgi:tripartite-type tricarboxylate transporter receptor subunit TctC
VIGSSATMRSEAGCQSGKRRAAWIGAAVLTLGLLAIGLSLSAARAQDHPNRPIRILIGSAAGGALDVEMRILGRSLPQVLGQDVVIENRPGGSGVIAGQVVASSPPDGNTLFAYAGDLFSVAALMPRTAFDANKQLVPISQISETPLVVVTGGHSKFSGVKGMVAAATASPHGLTYGTFAVASINNVVGQWIAKEAHIRLLNIPFRGGSEVVLATATGDVSLAIVAPAAVYPSMVNAGTVKIIGLTSTQRPSYLPTSWPTFAENGLPIDSTTFFGIFGPTGMSGATIARLNHGFETVLHDDAVGEQLRHVGAFAKYAGPAEFAKRIEVDRNRYDEIIQDMHMTDVGR